MMEGIIIMAKDNKPVVPESNKPVHIELPPLTGGARLRAQMKRKLQKVFLPAALLAVAAGYGSGSAVQNYEREKLGFNPEEIARNERQWEEFLKKEIQDQQKNGSVSKQAERGIFDMLREGTEAIRQAGQTIVNAEKITDVLEASRQYQEMRHRYNSLLQFIDSAAFHGPFWAALLLTMYAMVRLLNKISTLKYGNTEPGVTEGLQLVASAINRLGIQAASNDEGQVEMRSQIGELTRRMSRLESEVLSEE